MGLVEGVVAMTVQSNGHLVRDWVAEDVFHESKVSQIMIVLTLIGSWKKTYVKGKGGGKNDPKTKSAVTFFLLKMYRWNFQRL